MTGRRPGHRVVVIGSGWAGVAAALAARDAHADVTMIDGGPGASALGPGALDDVSWEDRERAWSLGGALIAVADGPEGGAGTDLAWLAAALGRDAYAVPAGGERLPLLATLGGRLRPARGRDTALLDVGRLAPGARVLVPRADRPAWDADALAALWSADVHARSVSFEAVDSDLLRFDDERKVPDAELAARHDAPGRIAWLAERLGEIVARAGDVAAVIVGPWLGLGPGRAAELERLLGRPVGEALAPLAATAGLRFEAARRATLLERGVRLVHGRARRIESAAGERRIELAMGEPIAADAVVLAIGGLVGGGIEYVPAEHGAGPEGADVVGPPLRTSVACGARVEIRGEIGAGSSTFGPALDDVAWPIGPVPGALEQAGIRAVDLPPGLGAAGDAVAGRPRTVGAAIASGRNAGRRAAASAV